MIGNKDDRRRIHTPPQILEYPSYIVDTTRPFGLFLTRYNKDSTEKFEYYSNTDSKEKFEQNLKEMPKEWHYRSKKIRYYLNSNNFRTYEWNEIDWKNAIVIYGCSNTFGVGVAENETIDKRLEKLTKRQVVNLGVPGGSNELIMHMAGLTIGKFGAPYAAITNWTTADRFRYFTFEKEHLLGAWDLNNSKKDKTLKNIHNLYVYRNLENYNEVMHTWYHAKTTKALFKGRSRYVSVTNFGHVSQYADVDELFTVDNNARDRLHPGPDVFEKMANYIAKFM